MKLPFYVYPIKEVVFGEYIKHWCALPYPNHKKGCPNYNKHPDCPPNSPDFSDFFDVLEGLWVVHSNFNLKAHSEYMKRKHPKWTDRQCRNVLYWQSRSKKQMKERVKEASVLFGTNQVHYFPEALGVHMYVTCLKAGLKLERIKDITECKHTAMIGFKKE